jgi:hypothetical protein
MSCSEGKSGARYLMPKPKEYKVKPEPSNDPKIDYVIEVMDRWFWLLEDGLAQKHFPNPDGIKVSPELATAVIKYIDDNIYYEVSTHTHYFFTARGMDKPADFNRLKGQARIAFVQDVLEAKRRMGLPSKFLGELE